MQTALFDYELPAELIAQSPCGQRDLSRLLVVDRARRAIEHHQFRDLPTFLRPTDVLIRNTARVLPARIMASRPTGGRVECLLLRPGGTVAEQWWCLLRPGKKLPPGSTFGVREHFEARVIAKSATAEYLVHFAPAQAGVSVVSLSERLGQMPLPPYIDPAHGGTEVDDRHRYQTVFADPGHTVAVAAPTAGLHFTPELLATIGAMGVSFADVVLHVGLGTFKPIESETVSHHEIHRERYEIPVAARALIDGPTTGRRVAVGTTSVRSVEAYARASAESRSTPGDFLDEAGLFLYPPAEFQVVDALITNFHMPRSTLLCLVAGFLTPGETHGIAWLHEIYAEAIRERYRFLSYGDAMLIL